MNHKTRIHTIYLGASFMMCFCAGCANFAYDNLWNPVREVSENRMMQQKPRYTITPSKLPPNCKLRFDGIYYTKEEVTTNLFGSPRPTPYTLYHFLRFWPSGEVMGSVLKNRAPGFVDAESFYGIKMGFYHIEYNILSCELYDPGAYILRQGRMENDTILFSRRVHRRDYGYWEPTTFDKITYSFLPIPSMKRQPDWSPTGMVTHPVQPNYCTGQE